MTKSPDFKILIVESNSADRKFLKSALQGLRDRLDVSEISASDAAKDDIAKKAFDLVLLDIDFAQQNNFEILREFNASGYPDIPILLLLPTHYEEDKLKKLGLGAIDAITKPLRSDEVRWKVGMHLKIKKILNDNKWANEKTNECIRTLYKELEKKNEKLKELDRLKSDFVNQVSHELRTPLTIIRESISQINDGLFGDVPLSQRRLLQRSLTGIDQLTNIVNDLLDIAKIENGKMELFREKVNMVALVEEIVVNFQLKFRNEKIELLADLPKAELTSWVDPEKITQVFINLIGNALKFTEVGEVLVAVKENENSIECSVRDTGRGIAQEDMGRLFSKFEQLGHRPSQKEKGTGLGLAIAKGIIDLHGGHISVSSTEGVGSNFVFTLPKF